MIKRVLFCLALIGAVSLVSACGGGSSSGDDSNPDPVGSSSSTSSSSSSSSSSTSSSSSGGSLPAPVATSELKLPAKMEVVTNESN